METAKASLSSAFKQSELLVRRSSCQQASIFTAVFMLVGTALDAVVYPELFTNFLILRIVSAAVLLILGYLIIRIRSDFVTWMVIHLMALIPVVTISAMIMMTEGADSPYYAGLNLVLMGAALLLRWSAGDSAMSGALCIICYVVAVILHGAEWRVAFIPSYFLFVTAAMACVGTYFINNGRFREFCLSKEIEGAKEKLEESYSQLKAMDDTKSRFFANISHELRTPLTLILGPTENLRPIAEESKDLAFLEHLDTIEDNAFRLLRLINDILDLVKLDSNESPPRPESVHVTDFISGLTSNLRAVVALKNIEISYISRTVEQEVVWLDRDRLEKIVLNLAVNAVKFTPPGGTITISACTDEGQLTLAVSDSGKGMSREELDNIFVRFWQADMSAKRKHRGAGIGLALVQSLTESMHGHIKVKSDEGKGSHFTVVIPAPRPDEGVAEISNDGPRDVIEEFNERARLTGATRFKDELTSEDGNINRGAKKAGRNENQKRVLIADDEDAMRNFIARQLDDYEVVGARDGAEAWQIIQDEKLDLIVLDLMMPELDGIEVTKLIRNNTATARIPIILVTAQASEAPRLKALEAGVNDFIAKPFSSIELRVRVKNLLTASEFEVGLAESNANLQSAYGKLQDQETILVQTEKLSSLGRMSAGIIHEVNNPLNYTKTALHALKTFEGQILDEDREDFLDVLGDAQEGVNRVIGIVSDLRSFTRGDSVEMSNVKLATSIESARRFASKSLSGITFEGNIDENVRIYGNDGQLCQLFINLFQNAARAINVRDSKEESGHITVNAYEDHEGMATVSVKDNGCGISKEDITHIFEPFFTKNDVGEGLGLGMSICHRIIRHHKGSIKIDSELGQFTMVILRFQSV